MQGEDLERTNPVTADAAPPAAELHPARERTFDDDAPRGTAVEPARRTDAGHAAAHATPVSPDIHAAPAGSTSVRPDIHSPPAAPVLADIRSAPPGPVAHTRRSLLAAYTAILDQIRELAPGDRSDRVAQLAEAAAALVGGEFAQRLVFGTSDD